MLPHTRDFTRHGCTVGARLITYSHLEKWFVCNECGGGIVHHIRGVNGQTVDWAECANCGGRDFVSLRRYEHQLAEFPDIVAGLPDELKDLFPSEVTEGVALSVANRERDSAIPVDRTVKLKRLPPSTTPFRGRLFKTEASQAIVELYDL